MYEREDVAIVVVVAHAVDESEAALQDATEVLRKNPGDCGVLGAKGEAELTPGSCAAKASGENEAKAEYTMPISMQSCG